jgi:polar amino acid transport system substrate-binding protein
MVDDPRNAVFTVNLPHKEARVHSARDGARMRAFAMHARIIRAIAALAFALACTVSALVGDAENAHAGGTSVAVPAKGQSQTIDAIVAAGKLRSAVAVALPDVGQDPNTNDFFGVGIEISKRIAQTLGVKLEIIPTGWDTMIAGLQSGRWDMVGGGLYATPARLKVVDMVTYEAGGFCYAVLKTNQKVNSLKDLDSPHVTIGTYSGTGTLQTVSKAHPNAKYDTFLQPPGQELRLDDLLAGRFDVAPFDSPIAAVLEAGYPQVKIIPGDAAGCIKEPDVATPSGLALPKGDTAYTEFVQSVVSQMQKSGELDQLVEKFSSPDYMKIVK